MLSARFSRPNRPPAIVFDEPSVRAAVTVLAAQFDRPMQDAMVTIEGSSVFLTEPRTGRMLDQDTAVAELIEAATFGAWPIRNIDIPVAITEPIVVDAEGAYRTASWLLESPIELRAFNQTWAMPPERIAPVIGTAVIDGRIALTVDPLQLEALLQPITDTVSRTAQNARFNFDDATKSLAVIEPGSTGRTINVERTAERLLELPNPGARRLQVAIDFVTPEIPDAMTADALGIRELIHSETSYFAGSSPDRVHNIDIAAERFNGALIPPDSVFSFNEQIGDITVETGYKETLIILDGATADGIGGGVCQVSTTLFRAAFWSGLPIVDRTAHGYRVGYYEQGAPMGLDATVYRPVLDFKFKNDTPAWILIETETDRAKMSVTFRFYGTDPGRNVEMDGPIVSATTPAPPARVEVDPSLPPGASSVVELQRSGASVTVKRVISGGDIGAEPIEDTFYSVYRPTGALTMVGPALDVPPSLEPEAGGDVAAVPGSGEGVAVP